MPNVREYLDTQGQSPYGKWFERLPAQAAAKVAIAVTRMSQGGISDAKGVGEGVMERRIDWGPGYRVYFAWDGATQVILLGGGSKKGQAADIKAARACWQDYRERKKTRS
jgi:putative addiction module killer protein